MSTWLLILGSFGGVTFAAFLGAMTCAVIITAHCWQWKLVAGRMAPTRSCIHEYMVQKICGLPVMHTQLATHKFGVHGMMEQPALVLAEIVQGMPNKHVLEVGCGKGACTLFLADLLPDHQFVGMDLAHVDTCKRLSGDRPNAHFVEGDMVGPHMSEALGTFDVMFACESLCYMDSKTKIVAFCRNAAALVRPKGRLVIIDIFCAAALGKHTTRAQMAVYWAACGRGIRALPAKETWCQALAEHGFVVLRNTDLTNQATPFWRRALWFVWPLLLPPLSFLLIVSPVLTTSFLRIVGTASALQGGSAEYGLLVMERVDTPGGATEVQCHSPRRGCCTPK